MTSTTPTTGALLGATPGVDIAAAVKDYDAEVAAIRAKLLAAVQADPLAAWIVEYALPAHETEALTVLRALPATLVQLDALAAEHGWCETWDDQVSAARTAGVLPAVAVPA